MASVFVTWPKLLGVASLSVLGITGAHAMMYAPVAEDVKQLRREMRENRNKLKADIGRVETGLKADIGRVEACLKADIGRVETDIGRLKDDIREIRQMLASQWRHDARPQQS